MTNTPPRPWIDASLPTDQRVAALVSAMALDEKITQMLHDAPAIERLGVPAYNWWSECLHGVARAGIATVFPQAIGMAASWNDALMHRVASAISDEGRAKFHEFQRRDDMDLYKSLTFWTPNVNIFRDPRWGRGHETYGECPFLTGRMGVAFVRGLQGDDETYFKSVATPKHYAVHSGPEPGRHSFDSIVSEKDLRETYLPAFHDCVVEGGAFSVMGAYNRTNGEPCCASDTLLQKILRDEWGFEGYVVSDCGAISDIHAHHKLTRTAAESAAMAVNGGCELNCGTCYHSLAAAVQAGLITEETIDRAVGRLFTARFRLGLFDPPEHVPYAQIPWEVNDCDIHRKLNLQMARESMVLLKNDGLLPLDKSVKTVAVIGPNAHSRIVLLGNYFGEPSEHVTPLDGIRRKLPAARVLYQPGCDFNPLDNVWVGRATRGISEAVAAAERADVAICCLGLTPEIEGEEMNSAGSDSAGGDRINIGLLGKQNELLQAVAATGTPTVLVLLNGSALAIEWAAQNVPAILEAWYPGALGGEAIADVLFGDYNPAGRLPVTFVRSAEDLPDFCDYAMKGRTYRYLEAEPLWEFGFGLSYSTFDYDHLRISGTPGGEDLTVSIDVTNTGPFDGDEVVQLYVTDDDASVTVPHRDLRGFQRVNIPKGKTHTVSFPLTPKALSMIDNDGKRILEPGTFTISVGPNQHGLTAQIEVTGQPVELPY